MRRSLFEVIMARSKKGEAIGPAGRSPSGQRNLRKFIRLAEKSGDLGRWRRGRAVLGYIHGRPVTELAAEAGVTRGSVNRWLQWYEAMGVEGLVTGKRPGPAPRLDKIEAPIIVARLKRAAVGRNAPAADEAHQRTLLSRY